MKYSAVLAAVGALGVGTAFAQEPIKIGVLYPLTGGGAVYGVPAMAGHQLAVEELNAKGGIMGRKIESIERDDKLNPASASSTMKELITKDKVDIVLGGLASSVGLAMSEVSKQEKVVYISTVGAFGNTRGQVVDESYEHPGGGYTSYYEETKVEAHRVATRLIAER